MLDCWAAFFWRFWVPFLLFFWGGGGGGGGPGLRPKVKFPSLVHNFGYIMYMESVYPQFIDLSEIPTSTVQHAYPDYKLLVT